MKNKNIIIISVILLIIILVVGLFSIKFVKNKKEKELNKEYTPQEEISDEQERQTIVSLYFLDKETNLLKPEARMIDIKNLSQEPYKVLVELLLQGPKNEKLKKTIPEETKLIKASFEKGRVTADFSIELLNYDKKDEKAKSNIINSIVNTLTELREVNKVKILINGEVNENFKDEYVRK